MAAIWVVEQQKTGMSGIATSLIGNYPVRLMASLASLRKILQISKKEFLLPDLLVIDTDDCTLDVPTLDSTIDSYLPGIARIYVGKSRDSEMQNTSLKKLSSYQKKTNTYFVEKPWEDFSFSRLVRRILLNEIMEKTKSVDALKYKDIILNYKLFKFQALPEGKPENLTVKETLLLKLFIEQHGQCLSRDSIQNTIWSEVKVAPRTIDSHISRLRKRLDGTEVSLESVYGGGYVLR